MTTKYESKIDSCFIEDSLEILIKNLKNYKSFNEKKAWRKIHFSTN